MSRSFKKLPLHAPHWKYDLPAPNTPVIDSVAGEAINIIPSHMNNTYLELSRSTIQVRGIGIFGGAAVLAVITCALTTLMHSIITKGEPSSTGLIVFGITFILVLYGLIIPTIRMDIQFPRDEPIRFNRRRRKVYFYEFQYDRIRMFSRSRWGVKPKVHDWDDLIAEACSAYVPGHGGLIEHVFLAVCKPGTRDVIARYYFAHDIEYCKKSWEIIRLYMQQGSHVLSEISTSSRDPNSDHGISPIRRLAPKVQWPPELDLESRTPPPQEDH